MNIKNIMSIRNNFPFPNMVEEKDIFFFFGRRRKRYQSLYGQCNVDQVFLYVFLRYCPFVGQFCIIIVLN